MDRRNAIFLEVIRRTLEMAEGAIDMLWIGEDLGRERIRHHPAGGRPADAQTGGDGRGGCSAAIG